MINLCLADSSTSDYGLERSCSVDVNAWLHSLGLVFPTCILLQQKRSESDLDSMHDVLSMPRTVCRMQVHFEATLTTGLPVVPNETCCDQLLAAVSRLHVKMPSSASKRMFHHLQLRPL